MFVVHEWWTVKWLLLWSFILSHVFKFRKMKQEKKFSYLSVIRFEANSKSSKSAETRCYLAVKISTFRFTAFWQPLLRAKKHV